VVLRDLRDEGVADEDVVDEFFTAAIDAAVSLIRWDARGEVPCTGSAAT
jgi:hypothetical protein